LDIRLIGRQDNGGEVSEQFRSRPSIGYGICIERSIDGKNWLQEIYVNTGVAASTEKLAVKIEYMLGNYKKLLRYICPEGVDCEGDEAVECEDCWDRFFNKKVDELGK